MNPAPRGAHHTLIIGDCTQVLPTLPAESIALICTSPPYYNAKFHPPNQFSSYENYLAMLRKAAAELYRVLAEGRIAAMVVDDVRLDGVLFPVVADVTKIMIDAGFRYRDRIVWKKPDGFVRISRRSGVLLQHPYPLYGYFDNLTETILILQKGTINLKKLLETLPEEVKERSRIDLQQWQKWSQAIWYITNVLPTKGRLEEAICAYPDEIPNRLIQLFSFAGETILDPFAGSGTTLKVARRLNRSSVGIEIRPELEPVIREKSGFDTPSEQDTFKVIRHQSAAPSHRTPIALAATKEE
jgi:DNA modification methylase